MPKNATKKGVAKPSTPDPAAGTILINLYDGTRNLLSPQTPVLLRIMDGDQRQIFADVVTGPTIRVTVPFQDGPRDSYTVLASADGYVQAGYFPVVISPQIIRPVFLMLIPKRPRFDFSLAQWDVLQQSHPGLAELFAQGTRNESAALSRYEDVMEQRPESIACLLNILTVMKDIDLPQLTPLDYLREIVWDDTLAQDRFFVWADRSLVDQIRLAAAAGAFAQEVGPGLLHPGATRSYKQVQFGEANLQFTFHERDQRGNGQDWVLVEPDIDYFKDMTAHALFEVIPGFFGLTDPKCVYVLRWIAGHQANVPAFKPPYVIRAEDE